MRYTDAIKVKASLLDDGVVDTLGLVGAMSGVRILNGMPADQPPGAR
jgi:hypothetical protein